MTEPLPWTAEEIENARPYYYGSSGEFARMYATIEDLRRQVTGTAA